MAGRPRKPADILELRGAFRKNPNRRREDAKGSAPFNAEPPAHLPTDIVPAWQWIVARLPNIALYSCDEIPVEMAARLLASYWADGRLTELRELRIWLGKLGLTPQDRTRVPPAPRPDEGNPFTNG